jgi:hypothetical protein
MRADEATGPISSPPPWLCWASVAISLWPWLICYDATFSGNPAAYTIEFGSEAPYRNSAAIFTLNCLWLPHFDILRLESNLFRSALRKNADTELNPSYGPRQLRFGVEAVLQSIMD